MQCTKKREARAKLLFCLLNLLFVDVLVTLASLDLTVPLEIAPKSPFLCVPTEALSGIVSRRRKSYLVKCKQIFKNNNTVYADVRASKNKDDSFFYAFPQSFRTIRDDVLGVFLYNAGPRFTKAS